MCCTLGVGVMREVVCNKEGLGVVVPHGGVISHKKPHY